MSATSINDRLIYNGHSKALGPLVKRCWGASQVLGPLVKRCWGASQVLGPLDKRWSALGVAPKRT